MTLEQLKIFIAVADYGGFSNAARALYISHSTTSRQVSALEEALGARLFNRTSRTVSLTKAGTVLYERGRALLENERALELEVREIAQIYK